MAFGCIGIRPEIAAPTTAVGDAVGAGRWTTTASNLVAILATCTRVSPMTLAQELEPNVVLLAPLVEEADS